MLIIKRKNIKKYKNDRYDKYDKYKNDRYDKNEKIKKKNKEMGFYECVYDCGLSEDGTENYCVDCASSLDGFQSPPYFMIICNKHKGVKGDKFRYDLSHFIKKFSKCKSKKDIYDVEIIEISDRCVKFKTDLDCSDFNPRDSITFSCFNDSRSWERNLDGTYNICTVFSQNLISRKRSEKLNVYYDWNTNKVVIGPVDEEKQKLHDELVERQNMLFEKYYGSEEFLSEEL